MTLRILGGQRNLVLINQRCDDALSHDPEPV